MRLKKYTQHEKWFDVPGEDGRVLVRERRTVDSEIMVEAMINKAVIGEELNREIMNVYLGGIADWDKITDEKGKPLPCEREHKALFLEQPGMIRFMREAMAEVAREGQERREAAEKN